MEFSEELVERMRDLESERIVSGESEVQQAERLFVEALPQAAQTITWLARFAQNEKLKLDAAKYVVERAMGRLGTDNAFAREDPLDKFLRDLEEEKKAQ